MRPTGISRSSLTINSIWKARGRRPTLRRTCKVYIPRDLSELDTLRLPATYEEDPLLVRKLKTFTKHKMHHLILVTVISIYLYAGAMIMKYLESHCICHNISNTIQEREEDLHELKNKETEKPLIRRFEIASSQLEHNANVSLTGKCVEWSIETSIFYCFTLITTIGYGDIAPCSNTGRAVTIFYAAMGVPLMFLVLADLGKLFTKAMKFVYRYFSRFYQTGTFRINTALSEKKPLQYMTVSWRTVRQITSPVETKDDNAIDQKTLQDHSQNHVTTLTIHNDELYKNLDFMNPDEKNHKHVEVEDDFHLPITAIVMVFIYMIVGGFLFQCWEEWTFFEGFYFVFISMTTVGLGDYTPQNQRTIMIAFVYLILGLMLNSMCINVIQEKITATFQKAKVRIGNDTVLNVHALLDNEDHKSRIHKADRLKIEKYENCYGFKLTPYKDSICNSNDNPFVYPPTSYYKAVRKLSEGESKYEDGNNLLSVPLQNRFKFYDSPYSTVQDDSQMTITSLKKF